MSGATVLEYVCASLGEENGPGWNSLEAMSVFLGG